MQVKIHHQQSNLANQALIWFWFLSELEIDGCLFGANAEGYNSVLSIPTEVDLSTERLTPIYWQNPNIC